MKFVTEFVDIALENLHREAALMKIEGWRFIQTHAVNTDNGIDLYYSFMKDGLTRNLKVTGVTKEDPVPSITDLFLAAFVFENEARELFGVDMHDIAIDFAGALYAPAEAEPMTFMTPEQKAAREKARKAQAAKEAKAAKSASGAAAGEAAGEAVAGEAAPTGAKVFVMTPERRARLDAKLANMSPEKIAKVEAALKAREAEAAAAAAGAAGAAVTKAKAPEAAAKADSAAKPEKAEAKAEVKAETAVSETAKVDSVLESKIALLDEAKAAKVRAALAGKSAGEAASEAAADAAEAAKPANVDAQLEAKIAAMDEEKAAKVRAALAEKAQREASLKGGE